MTTSTVVIAARWKVLWAYYGVGHLTGEEKHIRAAECGVFTASDSLLYYARLVADRTVMVRGEDLADLSDEIRRAESRLTAQ